MKFAFVFLFFFVVNGVLWSQVTYGDAFPNINFSFPVEIQNANDGSDRLFVVEQSGQIKVFQNSTSIAASEVYTFLDISSKVNYSSGQEIGLLGLAFHPNYTQNGYFYVYYVDRATNFEMVVARYQVNASNANLADPNSETIIFRFEKNNSNSNHNGGKIAFGPDGYLYVSIGDGGGAGDPNKNAQNLDIAFGSILRVDVDVDGNNPLESNPALPNGNYEIPSNNPRVGLNGLDELYAWGIRNTWKLSFDVPTGRLWGADVGQDDYEEINLIERGGNYGWNRFEANSDEDGSTNLVTQPDIKPIYYYDHSSGDVSITGGYVYRGSSNDPSIQGKYIFGDYVSGRVWSLDYNSSNNSSTSELLFRTNGQFISSFGLDESGEIYFSDYGSNAKIYKIFGSNTGPVTVPVNGIGNWAKLTNGTNGSVQTLAVTQDNLVYVGGEFTLAGGKVVANLATFDSNNGWSTFGLGTNGKVNCIVIAPNGDVVVGGDFSQIDGQTISNIAAWNGTSWDGLNGGTNGPVAKIGIDSNGNVFIGGAFETAGGITVNNIAIWNGNEWTGLTDTGTGITGTNNEIRAIAFDENNIMYVGGNFDTAGGNSAPRIATWNGSNWGTLGTGTSGFVQAIAITALSIYAGGNFSIAGGETVNRVARWNRDNQNWQGLGQGVSGNVNALLHDGSYLYVGGSFETGADVVNVNKIMNNAARWNDADGWQALGPGTDVGVSTQINALAFSNVTDHVYVSGNFSNAGRTNASNVAIWGLGLVDADNDGVADNDDDCLGTPSNAVVDFRGCEITALSTNNFRISVTGTSCRDTNNGKINIVPGITLNYALSISGSSVNDSYDFSSELEIDNLAVGEYDLCISVEGFPGYESCFKAIITEPEALEVQSIINKIEKSVTLKMVGSKSYNIMVNNLPIKTELDEITIFLDNETNLIEVSTDKTCQGTFKEVILLSNDPLIFPNPFADEINIALDNSSSKDILITIYDISGRLVQNYMVETSNRLLSLDTVGLFKGLYIIQVRTLEQVHTFKVVKQ